MADAKAAHTPGPWRWAEDRMNGGWAGLVGPDGQEVMFPAHRNEGDDGDAWFEPGDSISEADAKLIEAAPELLAALRDVVRELRICNDQLHQAFGDVGETSGGTVRRVLMSAYAAIAKAEGGDHD